MYLLFHLSRTTHCWKTCQSMQQLALEFLTKDTCTQLFPTVSKLLVHALVLPMNCERCFSAMNHTKTDNRNQMHTATLDRLLRVKIEGPSLQFCNFREEVARWSKAKKTQAVWKLKFTTYDHFVFSWLNKNVNNDSYTWTS